MHANLQHSGQLQNLLQNGTTSRNGPSNVLGQSFYQRCLPSQTASSQFPGQPANGKYLTQFTCMTQPATPDQTLTRSIPAAIDQNLAQENQLNSKCTLSTGNQDSQIILWNVLPNHQIFVPVNFNPHGAPNINQQNVPHSSLNSNNFLYVQQQPTFPVENKSLDEDGRNVSTNRLQHTITQSSMLKDPFKTCSDLSSDLKRVPTTEGAPHGQQSFDCGYPCQLVIPEKSTNANMQLISTSVQNVAAQRAVAVVTPLSPIGTTCGNISNESTNVKMNVRSAHEIVCHQPNIPHALKDNVTLTNPKGKPDESISNHQQLKSADPRLSDGLGNVSEAETDRSLHASSPKLKSGALEEHSPMIDERMVTNKTVESDQIPDIEWSLEQLHSLMVVIQQMEDGYQKVQRADAGKDILKLYWNGDSHKFYETVQSGIYQSIMQEVFSYCSMAESVILRQIKNDAHVIKDFHILKHDEEPPKMTYKSSWLNLNENVDDIDKECGYSWFYKSFQYVTEREMQNACQMSSKLEETTENPLMPRCELFHTAVENEVPAEESTLIHENLNETLDNGQSLNVTKSSSASLKASFKDLNKLNITGGMVSSDGPVYKEVAAKSVLMTKLVTQSDSHLPRLNWVAEQQEITLSQIQLGSKVKTSSNDRILLEENVRCENVPKPTEELPVNLNKEENVKVGSSASDMCVPHPEVVKMSFATEMLNHKVIAASPNEQEASSPNTSQVSDTISFDKQASGQRLEENSNNSGSAVQNKVRSLAEPNLGTAETMDKIHVEETSLDDAYCESIKLSSPVTDALPKPNMDAEAASSQPSQINSLKSLTNLVRILKERDVPLKRHQKDIDSNRGLKRNKHSGTSRLQNHFQNGIGDKSPVLVESTSDSDRTSPLTLSPLVEKPEFVGLIKMQNESSECHKSAICEANLMHNQELSVCKQTSCQPNAEDTFMGIRNLVKKVGGRWQIGKSDVLRKRHQRLSSLKLSMPANPSPMQNDSTKKCSVVDCVLTKKNVRCKTDPKPSQELCSQISNEDIVDIDTSDSIRIHVLPHEVAKQCFADQLLVDTDVAPPPEKVPKICLLSSLQDGISATEQECMRGLEEANSNGSPEIQARSAAFTDGMTCQSDLSGPPTLSVVTEQLQMQSQPDQDIPDIDCVPADENKRCETDPKPSQEFPMKMNVVEMEASSIRIDVLPHEVAKQCFIGTLLEETDVAPPSVEMHKACFINSVQNEISTKEEMHMGVLDKVGFNGLSKVQAKGPPGLHPVITEPSQISSDSYKEMPATDCMFTDESMSLGIEPMCSQEVLLNKNEIETNLNEVKSIHLNVLSQEMAEQWFVEIEDKNLQNKTSVKDCTDQVQAQALELKSEKGIFLEDLKPREQNSGAETLESYCCLAKWFQTLQYGDGSACSCQSKAELREKEMTIKVHRESLEMLPTEEVSGECEQVALENSHLESTDYSETTEDEDPLPNDPTMSMKNKTDVLRSGEDCRAETETSEQTKENELPSDMMMMKNNDETPTADLKSNSSIIHLSLFGSSSETRTEVRRSNRYKEKGSREPPPNTLQIIVHSRQKLQSKIKSKKCRLVESEDNVKGGTRGRTGRASLPSHSVSELHKNALSSTSVRKLISPSAITKSAARLGFENKQRRQRKATTQQMSINKYIIRRRSVQPRLPCTPESFTKSKYELGNPALMPLEDDLTLDFKVLPESFNFESGGQLNCVQDDTSPSAQEGLSNPEDDVERMNISPQPTQEVWSFSPLKKKHSQSIQVPDDPGSCSVFQEFKKRYNEKKDIASKKNFNSCGKA